MTKKILITGSQGFIGGYLCKELLAAGYKIVGLDDYSKYGKVVRPHDSHPNFKFFEFDAANLMDAFTHDKHSALIKELCEVEYIINLAALIGGISYFSTYAYDLFAKNERIQASVMDVAIKLYQEHKLKRIIAISSSMVFENAINFPTKEDEITKCPPPSSAYGHQKLSVQVWARAAWEQYKLPYTIINPFNCVGLGEDASIKGEKVMSGEIPLLMSHVLPDLIHKCLEGQDPLRILGAGNQVRCYTNGSDIARGIRLAMESDKAINEDFNISTPVATSVLELAEMVWKKINPDKPFRYESDTPFLYDVQKRVPDVSKAKEVLGFEAEITLDESVDEVIQWFRSQRSAKNNRP